MYGDLALIQCHPVRHQMATNVMGTNLRRNMGEEGGGIIAPRILNLRTMFR